MILKQKRIRSLDRHLALIKNGTYIVLGVKDILRFGNILTKVGFTEHLEVGETVLPSDSFGPVSRFNANGKYIIHKDQPKETAYRSAEWHWTEWRGRYDSEEMSKIVDVPYERYPRTFIPPSSIELKIATTTSGERAIVGSMIEYAEGNEQLLLHMINLFLEIFGECQVFTQELSEIIDAPLKRLNWQILPPGCRPWEQLHTDIAPLIKQARKGNQPVIEYRLETINKFGPDFVAVGQAGFRGYVIFGFTAKNLHVLESIYFGNATYVFDERWEELSKKTKAEILDQNLQTDRIIHREGWENRVSKLLKD